MDANKRILELMAQRNWSAYRLVKETNLSHSLIYNMVRRNNLPTIDTLTRISAAFGLSLQQFFTEDDDPAALSGEHAELLTIYHDVSADNRIAVLHLMELMAAGNKQKDRVEEDDKIDKDRSEEVHNGSGRRLSPRPLRLSFPFFQFLQLLSFPD